MSYTVFIRTETDEGHVSWNYPDEIGYIKFAKTPESTYHFWDRHGAELAAESISNYYADKGLRISAKIDKEE